jgi:hypothetical protein
MATESTEGKTREVESETKKCALVKAGHALDILRFSQPFSLITFYLKLLTSLLSVDSVAL